MSGYSLIFDRDLCVGCHACEIACKQEYDIPVGPRWMQVIPRGPDEVGGKLVLTFQNIRCMHCGKPPCINACPVDAITKRGDGIVLINPDLCIACKACIEACPFAAPQFNLEKNVVEKCTLCEHRLSKSLEPACTLVCPTGAIRFGGIHGLTQTLGKRRTKISIT